MCTRKRGFPGWVAALVWLVLASSCAQAIARPAERNPEATIEAQSTSAGADCTHIGQTWTAPRDGAEMVCVPAGTFQMGAPAADPAAAADEQPVHTVSLPAFWIDRLEVTNAMFARCVAAGRCHPRTYSPYLWGTFSRTRRDYYSSARFAAYPVIMLDADEAQAYCQWAGRRLPTEAEWEKAARGPDARLYPWGSGIDCTKANFSGCRGDTEAADSYPAGASPYGGIHMAGNLWEWVADWYDAGYYAHSPIENPAGPANGDFRTLRGGGWNSSAAELRVTNRSSGKPEHWADGQIGFRCATGGASY